MIGKYFDSIKCLNQKERPDRWKLAVEEFERVGLQNVEQFFSIPAEQPYQSFCISQYEMLQSFLGTKGSHLLTLEDDVIFNSYDHFDTAMKELPGNWDVLYLGANLRNQKPQYYSSHLRRIKVAYTTHAIAYSRKAVEHIISSYNPYNFEMYDSWLSDNVLGKFNCYVMSPMIAFQRPNIWSDLWGRETDYTSCFVDGNKMMA